MQINCDINHQHYQLEVEPTQRVLDVIRSLGLTAAKEGCGEGECGACSIFFNDKLVNSCLLLAGQMHDAKIMTLEGLKEETKEIRHHFEHEGAIQCGFCTGGFELRALEYIQNGGAKDETAVREALDGNLCRCTGYQKIVDAIVKSCP